MQISKHIVLPSPVLIRTRAGLIACISAFALLFSNATCSATVADTTDSAHINAKTTPLARTPDLRDCDSPSHQTILNKTSIQPDARAYWLNRDFIQWPGKDPQGTFALYASASGKLRIQKGSPVSDVDLRISTTASTTALPTDIRQRYKFIGEGALLTHSLSAQTLANLLTQQLILVQENERGEVIDFTAVQIAGVVDDLYQTATEETKLGATVTAASADASVRASTAFRLWAPTAQHVSACVYKTGASRAHTLLPMILDQRTGIWVGAINKDMSGSYYRYLVDVFVPGAGIIRNRVTDPYSISLTSDSRRSYITDLQNATLKPAGWDQHKIPERVKTPTDMSIYELHVRDFSINDKTVRPAYRGKYLAFTEAASAGMHHLQALSEAGITDIHLLPIFDIATIPERHCISPNVSGGADSLRQQTIINALADKDCFNWGYDPYHYNAPEGSYASNADNGATRILELRKMVMALHRAGLRVGMDVVYNHTAFAGQHPQSVLDRIVPGYYHRLNAQGKVEDSTCQPCGNTATENRMMAKLMSDSVRLWAREYKMDSFRFDLMGHQPRAVMEEIKAALRSDNGREIQLIGEGWNFGEVANGARFIQASQLALNGSQIGTFSDRARDAIRGGGHGDNAAAIVQNKGYINGLLDAADASPPYSPQKNTLQRSADMVRVGLAGSIADYVMQTADGQTKKLSEIAYNDQPAGYISSPAEVVNYVENHDNHTLFDINAFRLPHTTSHEDRARVQILGLGLTAFSQGIAYFHAGSDLLRSKSLDGNSYNSGDWFNRLDWTYQQNYFGTGLPPEKDNARFYTIMGPLLTDQRIKPRAQDIAMSRDAFRDLLRIRSSSALFRLSSSEEIQQRLRFFNTGPEQNPAVIAAHLNGENLSAAHFKAVMYFINVSKQEQRLVIPEQQGRHFQLHPVHLMHGAGDQRIASQAQFISESGSFILPALSVVCFVEVN
ncbi:alpha-1,6-glucosidase domain-containing protein [Undibacterium rivi]|uniref:alpha-1,6-glucosidase domain-containing protein n=1 Tax=Undibacterium rivi TaxID=2828729 RepID=UPI001BAEC3E6|nr:alpha-1,6-glucosidase domain-containing protein [Undibacterium rivi]